MKIELEEPFRSLWKRAYLRISNEGRRIIDLINDNNDRTTTSYARYLMCVKIGFILSNEFEVDHIDNDKTNDNIGNLQILTQDQNKLKEQYRYIENEQICFGYECAYCGNRFILTEAKKEERLMKTKTGLAFCSRSCNAKHSLEITQTSSLLSNSISQDKINEIKKYAALGLTGYRITKITGINNGTVLKYMK